MNCRYIRPVRAAIAISVAFMSSGFAQTNDAAALGGRTDTAPSEGAPSKPQILVCSAWVDEHKERAPLRHAVLQCGNFRTNINELTKSGWVQITQSSIPDALEGESALTQFDLTFRRDPMPGTKEHHAIYVSDPKK